jgi:PBP1b-binding outer membrane lipoprotein LpoB
MNRVIILAAFAVVLAGCSGAATRPDSGTATTGAAVEVTASPVAVAEDSPKKAKLSCVQ